MSGDIRADLRVERELGYYEAQVDEVMRMLAIFEHPIAQAKPEAAWMVLALGMDPETSLQIVNDMDEEEPNSDFYGIRLGVLQDRLRDIDEVHTQFLQTQIRKDEVVNVH
jgi:hypothetical protein